MPLDFFAPMDGGSAGTARTLFFFGGRRTLGAVERPNECGYLFASLVGIEHHKYWLGKINCDRLYIHLRLYESKSKTVDY